MTRLARYYGDENFDYPIVAVLRQFGPDVVTVQEVGLGGQGIPDPAVLAYATAAGRAVLTFNHLHFKRLHPQGGPHAGIISCTRDDDSAALAARIDAAVAALASLVGQFVRIVRPASP